MKCKLRRPSRRAIPASAFALKKYLGGIEPVSSTCDNEHATASLGQAEILGVQNPPRDCSFGSIHTTSVLPFFPWRLQLAVFPSKRAKKASEGVPFVAEDAGDVLPDDDAGGLSLAGANIVNCICKLHVFDGEGAARVGEAFAHTGNREGLAWGSADQHVRRWDLAGQLYVASDFPRICAGLVHHIQSVQNDQAAA